MYSPKIPEHLIPPLYWLARSRSQPMTRLIAEIVEAYLAAQDLAAQDLAAQDLAAQDLAAQDLAAQDLAAPDADAEQPRSSSD